MKFELVEKDVEVGTTHVHGKVKELNDILSRRIRKLWDGLAPQHRSLSRPERIILDRCSKWMEAA